MSRIPGIRGGYAGIPPGSAEQDPTTLYLKGPERRQRRPFASWLGWTHALRWRLLLTYVGVLVALLLILGIVLDVIVGSLLYQEERARFTAQVLANVTVNQQFFDKEVNGTQADCFDAISYQEAFENTIAEPLSKGFPAITSVYLLDRNGDALAPRSASTFLGTLPPYFNPADLTLIKGKIRQQIRPGERNRLYYQ